MPLRRIWAEMTTRDFADSDTSGWIAVLPVAAIEQHGPHLPVYTDTCIAEGMVRRSIELLPDDLPVTFLPVQAIGKSNEHISSPGTVTGDLGDDDQAVAGDRRQRQARRHREAHHRQFARRQRADGRHRGARTARAPRHAGGGDGVVALRPAGRRDGAGGIALRHPRRRIETSIMLHLRADLVRMENAKDFRSNQLAFIDEFKHLRGHGPVQFGWKAQDLNPDGALGNAAAAHGREGQGGGRPSGGGLRRALPRRPRLRHRPPVDAVSAGGACRRSAPTSPASRSPTTRRR